MSTREKDMFSPLYNFISGSLNPSVGSMIHNFSFPMEMSTREKL